MLLKPSLIAAAIPIPMAADLPLPLPAVKETVDFVFFSFRTSTKVIITLAWSRVLAFFNSYPMIYLEARLFLRDYNSYTAFLLMT